MSVETGALLQTSLRSRIAAAAWLSHSDAAGNISHHCFGLRIKAAFGGRASIAQTDTKVALSARPAPRRLAPWGGEKAPRAAHRGRLARRAPGG